MARLSIKTASCLSSSQGLCEEAEVTPPKCCTHCSTAAHLCFLSVAMQAFCSCRYLRIFQKFPAPPLAETPSSGGCPVGIDVLGRGAAQKWAWVAMPVLDGDYSSLYALNWFIYPQVEACCQQCCNIHRGPPRGTRNKLACY